MTNMSSSYFTSRSITVIAIIPGPCHCLRHLWRRCSCSEVRRIKPWPSEALSLQSLLNITSQELSKNTAHAPLFWPLDQSPSSSTFTSTPRHLAIGMCFDREVRASEAEVEAKFAAAEGRDAVILRAPEAAKIPEPSGTWIGS